MMALVPAGFPGGRVFLANDLSVVRAAEDGSIMKTLVIVDRATMEDDRQLHGYGLAI
jgi:hypothetical protein